MSSVNRRAPGSTHSETALVHCCHACSGEFTTKNHLKRHMLTHEDDRKHSCSCGKAFTRKDLLTRHQRTCGKPKPGRVVSRRKACNPCVTTKSKCDLGQPCFKCILLDKECSYVTPPGKAVRITPQSPASAHKYPPNGFLFIAQDLSLTLPTSLNADYGYNFSVSNAFPAPHQSKHEFNAFFSKFLSQIPIIHPHTWDYTSKPSYLLLTMQACGAVSSGTSSQNWIDALLFLARHGIFDGISSIPPDPIPTTRNQDFQEPYILNQVYLLLAVDLLQAIRIFDHRLSVRKRCIADHDHLVRCVQASSLFSAVESWCPPDFGDLCVSSIDRAWRSWARYETAKRAMWISQLQDFSQVAFFGRTASYTSEDRAFRLPSEEALWNAPTSKMWYSILTAQSPYGCTTERMLGIPWRTAISRFQDHSAEPLLLNPTAHFILIHYIFMQVGPFVIQRPQLHTLPDDVDDHSTVPYVTNDELLSTQRMLHNWLLSLKASPETPREDDLFYMHNKCMTFYWATQLLLLARHDRLLPITADRWTVEETTFLVMMHWMKYIRFALEASDEPSAEVLWNGLLQIQLKICNAHSPDAVEFLGGLFAFLRV